LQDEKLVDKTTQRLVEAVLCIRYVALTLGRWSPLAYM